MQKLRDTINNLYLNISQKPRSLVPSDAAAFRDRRLLELASKIEKLKQVRQQRHLQQ